MNAATVAGPRGIPVIDVASLVQGEDDQQTAAALRNACQDAGFAYIRNHGIAESVIENARTSAMTYFLLPDTIKSETAVSRHHRGWLTAGSARMADDALPDLKESFIWANEDGGRLPDHSLRGPNQWPDQHLADFSPHAIAWFDCAQHLSRCLLRGFASSFGLDRGFFLQNSERPLSRASFVYYPCQSPPRPDGQFGVGPHTDFGVLTVLCQDHIGGLQIENANGEWINAPPIDDTLIVNVGDLLARWTNGVLRSAPHRVTSPHASARLSLVLAFDPNPETMIDARQVCPDAADWAEPVACGDYLDWRFSRAFAYRSQPPASTGTGNDEPGT